MPTFATPHPLIVIIEVIGETGLAEVAAERVDHRGS
jgi:hypothetical protein